WRRGCTKSARRAMTKRSRSSNSRTVPWGWSRAAGTGPAGWTTASRYSATRGRPTPTCSWATRSRRTRRWGSATRSKRQPRPRGGRIPCPRSIGTTASPRRCGTSRGVCAARRRRSPTARPDAWCKRSSMPRTKRSQLPARVALALFALAAPVAATGQARRLAPDDLAMLVRLSDPEISPDGRAIAFLAARPNYEANRYDTELILLDIATGGQRVLVAGRPGLGGPHWAPPAAAIAFLATVEGQAQVFVLPLASGEARAGPRAPAGVRGFAWRPDGGAIAYVAPDTATAPTERSNDAFEVGNDDYLTAAPPAPAHVWLVSLATGEASRVTLGDWSVATSLA